jgi:hypothetical protein
MNDDAALADELRRSLRARADAVSRQTPPFVATDIEFHPELGDGRHRHRRPVWVVVAAAAAAVLLLVGVGFWLRSHSSPSTITVVGTGPSDASAASAAPSWLPPGLKVWSVESLTPQQAAAENAKMRSTYPGLPRFVGAVTPQPIQLFGADGDTTHSILLSATPTRVDMMTSDHHRPLRIRGQDGAYEAVGDGNGGHQTRLTWHEGATFTADLRGVRMRDAVTFLNGLQWRTQTHADGFRAPTSGRFRLLASAPRFTPNDAYTPSVTFDLSERPMTFGTGAGRGRPVQLSIVASGPSSFLDTWFSGHRRSDGAAESIQRASRSLDYTLARTDGRTILVEATGNPTIALADARHLVASLKPTSERQLDSLTHAAAQRSQAYLERLGSDAPLRWSANTSAGTVELRGTAHPGHETADSYYLICLVAPHGNRRCSGPISGDRGKSSVTAAFSEPDGWFAVHLEPHGQANDSHTVAFAALDDPRHAYDPSRRLSQQTIKSDGMLLVTAQAPKTLTGVWFGQPYGSGNRIDRPID